MGAPARLLRLRAQPSLLRSSCSPRRRDYHSYDHPPPPGPFGPVETSILSAAMPHINAHGFTQTTLALGAKDARYIDASTNLFPKGAFSLVHFHLYRQRRALESQKPLVEATSPGAKVPGITDKVKSLTWKRLEGNKDVIHRWQEALALMAQPSNVPTSMSELWSLADEIWFLAGDAAVDSSWYTKRASLATVYAATDLFMTTDTSPDYRETQEFLDRRFRDAQFLGGAIGGISDWVSFTGHAGLNVLRSKGVRI